MVDLTQLDGSSAKDFFQTAGAAVGLLIGMAQIAKLLGGRTKVEIVDVRPVVERIGPDHEYEFGKSLHVVYSITVKNVGRRIAHRVYVGPGIVHRETKGSFSTRDHKLLQTILPGDEATFQVEFKTSVESRLKNGRGSISFRVFAIASRGAATGVLLSPGIENGKIGRLFIRQLNRSWARTLMARWEVRIAGIRRKWRPSEDGVFDAIRSRNHLVRLSRS